MLLKRFHRFCLLLKIAGEQKPDVRFYFTRIVFFWFSMFWLNSSSFILIIFPRITIPLKNRCMHRYLKLLVQHLVLFSFYYLHNVACTVMHRDRVAVPYIRHDPVVQTLDIFGEIPQVFFSF